MTQMQAVGDYELQLCVLLTGVNSGGLPALIEWDFLLLCRKAGKWQEPLSYFFRIFRMPSELWLTYCWEPSLVSWHIIGVTFDNCSLEDSGQEGGDVQTDPNWEQFWNITLTGPQTTAGWTPVNSNSAAVQFKELLGQCALLFSKYPQSRCS